MMLYDFMVVVLLMVFGNGCRLVIDLWMMLNMGCGVMRGRLRLFM